MEQNASEISGKKLEAVMNYPSQRKDMSKYIRE